jgi:hypothetical protein
VKEGLFEGVFCEKGATSTISYQICIKMRLIEVKQTLSHPHKLEKNRGSTDHNNSLFSEKRIKIPSSLVKWPIPM